MGDNWLDTGAVDTIAGVPDFGENARLPSASRAATAKLRHTWGLHTCKLALNVVSELSQELSRKEARECSCSGSVKSEYHTTKRLEGTRFLLC
jgi:hypothetical protein